MRKARRVEHAECGFTETWSDGEPEGRSDGITEMTDFEGIGLKIGIMGSIFG